MRYLTVEEILFIHLYVIDLYFDNPEGFHESRGVSQPELLDSAVALPAQTFGGQELYRDLFWKAAALFRSIVKNHSFVDGNKRTASLALLVFLDTNGYTLQCSDDELIAFALRVAARKRPDLRKMRYWIRKRCRRSREPRTDPRRTLLTWLSSVFGAQRTQTNEYDRPGSERPQG